MTLMCGKCSLLTLVYVQVLSKETLFGGVFPHMKVIVVCEEPVSVTQSPITSF